MAPVHGHQVSDLRGTRQGGGALVLTLQPAVNIVDGVGDNDSWHLVLLYRKLDISDGQAVTGPAVDPGPYRGAGSGQGSWPMTVALNGAASSSSSGAYAPVAAAWFIWASRASADSQSAISTRTSGSSTTLYRVLPRNPSWPGPCVAIRLSSTPLSSSRRPGLACSSTITVIAMWSSPVVPGPCP